MLTIIKFAKCKLVVIIIDKYVYIIFYRCWSSSPQSFVWCILLFIINNVDNAFDWKYVDEIIIELCKKRASSP